MARQSRELPVDMGQSHGPITRSRQSRQKFVFGTGKKQKGYYIIEQDYNSNGTGIRRKLKTNGKKKMTDSQTTNNCQIRSGDTVAHCRVLRQISVSGAVSVCLVRHEIMGDLRLLKMVSAGPDQQDAVNRLIREARTAGLVDHPNLVKVLDAGLDRERNIYYVSMEYANGCTLAEILAMTGQLSEFHALIIAEEVAAALSALSRHDVVHHSIDPENILLTRL